VRVAEMLAFQSYNVKSPLNGEAARWVEQNSHALPLDSAPMAIEETLTPSAAPGVVPQVNFSFAAGPAGVTTAPTAAAVSLASPANQLYEFGCSACPTRLRVSAPSLPVCARCPTCRQLTTYRGPAPASEAGPIGSRPQQ